MSSLRGLVIRVLPDPFVDWYRGRRVALLEAAGGTTSIPASVRVLARRGLLRVLPEPVEEWAQRKRASRRYLNEIARELVQYRGRTRELEVRAALRTDAMLQRVLKDVLERTDIVLQQLDRRIEGVTSRSEERLSGLEDEVAELRRRVEELGRLLASVGSPSAPAPPVT